MRKLGNSKFLISNSAPPKRDFTSNFKRIKVFNAHINKIKALSKLCLKKLFS